MCWLHEAPLGSARSASCRRLRVQTARSSQTPKVLNSAVPRSGLPSLVWDLVSIPSIFTRRKPTVVRPMSASAKHIKARLMNSLPTAASVWVGPEVLVLLFRETGRANKVRPRHSVLRSSSYIDAYAHYLYVQTHTRTGAWMDKRTDR